LDASIQASTQPELSEKLRYARARLLEEVGRPDQALNEYLRLADDFPYPHGAYWDDALWRAATLAQSGGDPRRALALLQRMLVEVEPAHFQGSYARARFAEAQYRIAEIYRDDLHQMQLAQMHFRKVFDEHPTSLLRDDALWQEALTATAAGNTNAACAALETLRARLPTSRYAPCAKLLCPNPQYKVDDRNCRSYIRRSLGMAAATVSEAKRPPSRTQKGQSSK
jgi:tetratricopeptide (TPR) repeat protein